VSHQIDNAGECHQRGVNDTFCLITDVHMPGLSGVELHRRLLDDGFAAPTIFVSGLADETIRSEALAAGEVGFPEQALWPKIPD
jgi:FixJ family two-component response regulator